MNVKVNIIERKKALYVRFEYSFGDLVYLLVQKLMYNLKAIL